MKSSLVIPRLVVIGLGLIGGSLAAAAKQRSVVERVIGIARKKETCEKAVAMGIVHEAFESIDDIAGQLTSGDVIFIAVPTLSVAGIFKQLQGSIAAGVTITDGASVKGSVLADVQKIYGCFPANIVLGHPIAGSEKKRG